MSGAVTIFRTLPPAERQMFVARAAGDCDGAEIPDLCALAGDPLYHPVYRREIARILYLRLDDVAKHFEVTS